jgi:hypothetical protein
MPLCLLAIAVLVSAEASPKAIFDRRHVIQIMNLISKIKIDDDAISFKNSGGGQTRENPGGH